MFTIGECGAAADLFEKRRHFVVFEVEAEGGAVGDFPDSVQLVFTFVGCRDVFAD